MENTIIAGNFDTPGNAGAGTKNPAAARDITTQLGTLDKLAKQGFKFDREQPKDLFEALSAWANHNRTIGANGGSNDFDTETAAFEKLVRAAGDWAN